MLASQRVITNTLFLYVRMGISILVNIFVTRILLGALGESDYGLYNVVGGAIAMLGFISASMSSTTQRFLNYAEGEGCKEKIKLIFNNAVIIHRGISLITIILLISVGYILFKNVLNIPQGREVAAIIVYICMLFSTTYSITIAPYDAALAAHENMLYYSLLGIGDVILKLIIAIAILYSSSDRLILYAILMALEAWLLRVTTQLYCNKHYEECKDLKLKKYYDKSIIRKMASFAGWNIVNIASSMIALYGINIAVNHFFGTKVNAALGIATQLSGVLMGVSANMLKALTPVLVKREGAHLRTSMLEITYTGCKFSFLLFSFFCIPICFFINPILNLWLHTVPSWTTLFCLITLVSALVDQLFTVLYQTISAKGDIKNFNIALLVPNILALLLTVTMFYMGLPAYWGLINWLIWRIVIGGLVKLYYSHKEVELSIRRYFKSVVKPSLVISIITSVVNLCLSCTMKFHWITLFAISIITSIPLYWYVALTKDERDLLRTFISRII